jgi:hypothetical protein
MTLQQIETAKARAAVAALNLQGDDERAEEFESMTPEEYAEQRGIEIINQNPKKKGANHMPRKSQADRIADLEAENAELREKVEDYEAERLDALEALGVEIIDEDEDLEDEESDEGNGDED